MEINFFDHLALWPFLYESVDVYRKMETEAEASTTAAAGTETEAVPVRKSCKQNQTSDTLQARVW